MPDLPPKIQAVVEKAVGKFLQANNDLVVANKGKAVVIILEHLAPAIAELVRDVRLEDAKAVCPGLCGKGFTTDGRSVSKGLYHNEDIGSSRVYCEAGPIWDIIAKEKDDA